MPLTQSVLGSVTIGFEPIWNRRRQVFGFRLWVDAPQQSAVDGAHFLRTLSELFPQSRHRPLILHIRNESLLRSVLQQDGVEGIWVAINHHLQGDAAHIGTQLRLARARGITLVWQDSPGRDMVAEHAPFFSHEIQALSAEASLRVLRRALQDSDDMQRADRQSAPALRPDVIYEGLASPAVVEYALDRAHALAVVGWPSEEVLHTYRRQQLQPCYPAAIKLLAALDSDASVNDVQSALTQEPLLTYRFLLWANSASMAMGRPLESVRDAILAVGYGQAKDWLLSQTPQATSDANLNPVRLNIVLRAMIMEHLCEAGIEEALRREVYLCGLLSSIDYLLGTTLSSALSRLPLPSRITSAILGQTGPYAPFLEVAQALESGHTGMIRETCATHGITLESANRALLRALGTLPS